MPNKRKRRQSAAYKAQYTNYKVQNKAARNKDNKLLRHMLKHPNDKQSEERRVPQSYKRKKPYDYWETQRRNSKNDTKRRY